MQHPERQAQPGFGAHVRRLREARAAEDPAFSLRRIAGRCGITPAYLSRIERGEVPPPGEETLAVLAEALGEDRDVLMALAGKVSADLRAAILARPKLFAELIRTLRELPDRAVLRLVREARDGDW